MWPSQEPAASDWTGGPAAKLALVVKSSPPNQSIGPIGRQLQKSTKTIRANQLVCCAAFGLHRMTATIMAPLMGREIGKPTNEPMSWAKCCWLVCALACVLVVGEKGRVLVVGLGRRGLCKRVADRLIK